MKYGRIKNGKVEIVIVTDSTPRGYSGKMFYEADGRTLKSASDIIAEQGLKPIIVSDETHPISYYTFEEKTSRIDMTDMLTEEAAEKVSERAKLTRICEIQPRLDALSQDIVQHAAGEAVPGIQERRAEFIALHNELRGLLGLEPRETV